MSHTCVMTTGWLRTAQPCNMKGKLLAVFFIVQCVLQHEHYTVIKTTLDSNLKCLYKSKESLSVRVCV